MLSVALFSSVENIKKLLFTASFWKGFKLFIPRQFSLLFFQPHASFLGLLLPLPATAAPQEPPGCAWEKHHHRQPALRKGQPVSLALAVHLPSPVKG